MAVIGRFLESAIWCGYQGGHEAGGLSILRGRAGWLRADRVRARVIAGPHDALIAKHAAANGVPEQLVRRVIQIESRGNAVSRCRGNYGLMQIRLGTARGVGYSGEAQGLLDADTNLTYAVRYLAGAYRAAGCDADRAVRYYQRGYYGAAAARMRWVVARGGATRASCRDKAGRCHQAEGGPHRDDRAEVGSGCGAADRQFRAGARCAAARAAGRGGNCGSTQVGIDAQT